MHVHRTRDGATDYETTRHGRPCGVDDDDIPDPDTPDDTLDDDDDDTLDDDNDDTLDDNDDTLGARFRVLSPQLTADFLKKTICSSIFVLLMSSRTCRRVLRF